MRIFNYAAYAKTLELGIVKPNKTKIARALFEPIINHDGVFNRFGEPYTITSKNAKAWYDQTSDIPESIKVAAGLPEIVNTIGNYFFAKIVDGLVNQKKEDDMYTSMRSLVRDSNLPEATKQKLDNYYKENERAEFLGQAFLSAVVGDNLKTDELEKPSNSNSDEIRALKELIKKSCRRPVRLIPSEEIENHELGYVGELYDVYHEETGKTYKQPSDLDSDPKLKRDFNTQRKDYYSAETIRRELRDTMCMEETEGFDILKDEIYEGVIRTRDKDYSRSFLRLTAVMDLATVLSISNNLNDRLLDWVGAAEKRGVCHMLVNDKRLTWKEYGDDV